MGRDDETEILAAVDVVEEYFFVGRPCAAGDENGVPLGEAFDEREGTCGATDVDDAVKTGVAGDGDVVGHADARKEFDGKAVLDKKMGDAAQTTGITAAVPLEKDLSGAENAADGVDGNAFAVEYVDVVAPKLVFDEDGHLGMGEFDETARGGGGVEGEVANEVRTFVVFAHFIAGGREEGEEDFALGLFATQAFDERTSLFEFAE